MLYQQRICCYTAITGGYDKLYDPLIKPNNIDYICFSDNPNIRSSCWQVRQIPGELLFLSKVKQQRVLKICPHKYLQNYDISIWIDGNVRIIGDLNSFISEYDLSKSVLYTRVHPSRNCIYKEAQAIVKFRKDTPDNILPIVERYKKEGYPENIGMAETNILLRKHNDAKCVLFDNAWATELLLYSHRDQMSFNYIVWKLSFLPGYLNNQFKMNDNKYFKLMPHG